MPSIKAILMVSGVAFNTIANGHMIMAHPIPYGSPSSSPLKPDGSDFPCKSASNAGATVNNMAIGAPQALSFNGSAVHGGGSCQVSLTKDTPPTKNSKWQVIHSIAGGCPAKGQQGNLPEPKGDPTQASDPDKYSFTIPQGISPGAYTLAWTWFNKIGNREMYMNCASVKVTGGSSKRDTSLNETAEFAIPELSARDTSFPDMFVANVPTTDCTTAEGGDLEFPNPGSSVEKDGSGTMIPPKGPKCGAASGGSSSSSGSSSSGSGSGPASAGSPSPSGSSGSSGSSSPASSPAAAAPSTQASSGASPGADSQINAGSGSSGSSGAAAPSGSSAAPAPGASNPSSSPSGSAPASGSSDTPSGSSGSSAAAPSAPAPSAGGSGSTSGSDSPSGAAPAGGASSSSGSTAPSTGVCTTAGASICSPDGRQIGTCTSGLTLTWVPVAAGTKCSGGMQVFAKRSARFAGGYAGGK